MEVAHSDRTIARLKRLNFANSDWVSFSEIQTLNQDLRNILSFLISQKYLLFFWAEIYLLIFFFWLGDSPVLVAIFFHLYFAVVFWVQITVGCYIQTWTVQLCRLWLMWRLVNLFLIFVIQELDAFWCKFVFCHSVWASINKNYFHLWVRFQCRIRRRNRCAFLLIAAWIYFETLICLILLFSQALFVGLWLEWWNYWRLKFNVPVICSGVISSRIDDSNERVFRSIMILVFIMPVCGSWYGISTDLSLVNKCICVITSDLAGINSVSCLTICTNGIWILEWKFVDRIVSFVSIVIISCICRRS